MGHRGKSIPLAQKHRIILKWEGGIKNKARIAREVHTTKNTVYKWISSWEKTESLDPKHGHGCKPVLDSKACARALQLVAVDHHGAQAAARRIFDEGLAKRVVSRTTVMQSVKQYAESLGTPITSKRVKRKRRLTAKNKEHRLSFCKDHRHDDFKYVMFTDRCKFLFRHPGEQVHNGPWHFVGDTEELYTVTNPDAFNVYGGITLFGTTRLRVVSGTTDYHPVTQYTTQSGTPARNITSSEYEDVLLKVLLPCGHELFHGHDWTLQQDNDPTHAAASKRAVTAWNKALKDKGLKSGTVTILEMWPPNSPDLSIIENVWAIVQRRANAAGCKTFREYKAKVEEEFANISPDNLFASIPKRMKECIKARGDRTKH
jgi:transposase-like protein